MDAVFSRIGSADNLYRHQSTFMVEMLETAHILRQATPRSFVIMDEIGRGTTPEDGTAVAFASLHHLVHVNRCRTLFASHFHALADLAAAESMCVGIGEADAVETYCTDVREDEQAALSTFTGYAGCQQAESRSPGCAASWPSGRGHPCVAASARWDDNQPTGRRCMTHDTLTPSGRHTGEVGRQEAR